ncbi:LysR family transcriptional regulator substrate-binding protein [Cellulomonas telluris]|uniref:LysR family transcriptional regulator substrate-binding protein n=1 Tax=Cellulomonas telluris TaxID=2306636 RepID=UPI0010A7FD67|nr:LysR family transcriptional regulator substrate-binding protein [Cellulomonas telluris]
MRLLLVPGVSPDRWVRVWAERVPDEPLDVVRAAPAGAAAAVLAGEVDAAVLRLPPDPAPAGAPPDLPPPGLPSPAPSTRDGWAVVPLWEDRAVVVVPREHLFTVVEAVDLDDLRAEPLLVPGDDVLGAEAAVAADEVTEVPDTPTALDLVASGAGVVVLPHALAREHGDKRFAVRDVPEVPGSRVALVWHRDAEHPLVQELVGIVRGRTAGSSRGDVAAPPAPPAPAVAGRGASPRTPRPGARDARPARGRGRRAR